MEVQLSTCNTKNQAGIMSQDLNTLLEQSPQGMKVPIKTQTMASTLSTRVFNHLATVTLVVKLKSFLLYISKFSIKSTLMEALNLYQKVKKF